MATHPNPLIELSNAMADAVEQAAASTVMVNARRRLPASGIVFTPELILTADHVIERDGDISVMLPNGTEVAASVAGRDPGTDLAVLRLPAAQAQPAARAEAEARIGQIVLALGRPSPEGIQASLGVISSASGPVRTGRGGLLDRYLVTDTIPYPGFSGGPLIDASGRVLGLNTSGLAHGTSVAITTRVAWQVAETLAKHGHMQRGYLGVRSQTVELPEMGLKALENRQTGGLLLVNVEENSPAARAGLIVGDILVGFSGQPLQDHEDLVARLADSTIDQPAPVELLRGGQVITVDVIVGAKK